MAKTTTRPKPASKKMTSASGSATSDGAADIRMIPLDRLEPSPLNPAKSPLPFADKQALFARATGLAIKPQLSSDNRPSPIIEEIGAQLDVDVAACWRPTAQNYWGRVNKGHAVATARKLIGDDYAEDRNRERRGDIAAAMERADVCQPRSFWCRHLNIRERAARGARLAWIRRAGQGLDGLAPALSCCPIQVRCRQ